MKTNWSLLTRLPLCPGLYSLRHTVANVLQMENKNNRCYWTSSGNLSPFQSVFFCLVPNEYDPGMFNPVHFFH